MKRHLPPLALLAVLPFALVDAPTAEACGGTFCDTGPTSMPVDQTGENILFILDGQNVEAHIQIQYDPNADADKFAWVIPMQVLPEFSVGSDALFQNLLAGTVPTYGYNTTVEPCGDPGGTGGSGTGDGDGDAGDGDGDGDGDPGPMVVYQDIVGAFEITVLDGGTVDSVMQWLSDNGYQQDPNAAPILGEYLAEGYMFVALKLAMNAGVDELQPIVLRYQGDEPCVPLRLTRIAAVDDMDVRVFFLGDKRAVPSNYRHVLVNPLMINWMTLGGNYKEVVSLAVDAFAAEGNAFVTEYAGNSGVVSQFGLSTPGWDATPFLEMQNTPELVGAELENQGLMQCIDNQGVITCEAHPMIQPLLDQYLPVPNNVDPGNFYSCMLCYAGLIDDAAWNATEFGNAIDERVIQPGLHATELLNTWPYLTRMFTTISPNEMMVDPIFHTNGDLPDVPNVRIGNRELLCAGGAVFTLPDGREVYMPNPSTWPIIPNLPWEEDVEQAAMVGPNQSLSDRTDEINTIVTEWNCSYNWPSAGACGNAGDGDGDGDSTGDGDGDPTTGDGDTNSSGTSGGPDIDGEGASCACSTEDAGTQLGGLALFGMLGIGLGWGLRRRERD